MKINLYTLLGLLCFGTKESAFELLLKIDDSLFENEVEKEFYERVVNYITKYQETPKENLRVLFPEAFIEESSSKFDFILENIGNYYYSDYKEELILENVIQVFEYRKLKRFLEDVNIEIINNGLEATQSVITQLLTYNGTISSIGVHSDFSNLEALDEVLDKVESGRLTLGNIVLDSNNICLTKGRLFIYGCETGKGKTMMLDSSAVANAELGCKVLRINLDLPLNLVKLRLITRVGEFVHSEVHETDLKYERCLLIRDGSNKIKLNLQKVEGISVYDYKNHLTKRHKEVLSNIFIVTLQRYVSSVRTVDLLIRQYKPDLLQIDYPALFAEAGESVNYKGFQGLFEFLSGLASTYDIAVQCVHQIAPSAKVEGFDLFDHSHLYESKGIHHPADLLLIRTSTGHESSLGLARLFVDKKTGSDGGAKKVFAITQDYRTNTCITSCVKLTQDEATKRYYD